MALEFKGKENKKHLSSWVNEDVSNFIDYIAATKGISRSKVVEQIIEYHMTKYTGKEEEDGTKL